MIKTKMILFLFVFLLFIPIVFAENYRQEYSFSDVVFDDLPAMPEDFWLKKQLFDTQQIQASRLTPEYYLQPELYPGWAWSANQSYTTNNHMVGVYGINAYPSRFDIFMSKHTESFSISFLLFTGFGIEIYQGARLVPYYDAGNITITQVVPNSDTFLLTPTYPKLNSTWSRIVIYNITASIYGEKIITIMEEKPDNVTDNLWSDEFDLYASGGSILGLVVPKVKIMLHGIDGTSSLKSDETKAQLKENTNQDIYLFIASGAIVVIFAIIVFAARKFLYEQKKRLEK